MDPKKTDLWSTPIPPGATEADAGSAAPADAPRPGPMRSLWHGAKVGFRGISYIAGPIAFVFLAVGLAVIALSVGAGRGWGMPPALIHAVRFYASCALLGAFFGGAIGFFGGLIRRAWPRSRLVAWWAAANRPIRLFQARRGVVASPDGAPPRRRPRRWPWWVGVALLMIVATAFWAGVYLGRWVDRRLAAAIAAADRDDPSWRLADLMAHRDPVPDEENSALVVAEAVSLLPDGWPNGPAPPPGAPKPPPSEVEQAYNRPGEKAANVQLDDATAETLRGELKAYAEAVEIARTVAGYDRGRHELVLRLAVYDTLLPETQAARTPARLLVADAAIRAHDGDLDGALDSSRAALAVGRSIGDEPFLISQLVRIAIGGVAMKSARRALGQGEPSDAALGRLQALLLDELSQPLLLHALRGERAAMADLIRRIRDDELPPAALSGLPVELLGSRDAIAPWGKLLFDNYRAVSLEWMNAAVAIARQPPAARPALWKAWDAEVLRVRKSRPGVVAAAAALLLASVVVPAATAHARYHAELGSTAILLAAERHRRKAGAWPASVAAIDRAILPDPPVDPYSGRDFRLEHRDGQLLVYSIGPDGKDGHGAYNPRGWMRGGPDDVGTGAWDVPLRRRPPGQ
jgi:hypothetical protein